MNKETKTDISKNIIVLQEKKEQVYNSFNIVALTMINHLATVCPLSYCNKHKDTIALYFKMKPAEPIVLFINHVYMNDTYVKSIKNGDDGFFMAQNYDDLEDNSKIFEFKELWKLLTVGSQNLVKKSMNMLVDRVETYINILSEINTLKKN